MKSMKPMQRLAIAVLIPMWLAACGGGGSGSSSGSSSAPASSGASGSSYGSTVPYSPYPSFSGATSPLPANVQNVEWNGGGSVYINDYQNNELQINASDLTIYVRQYGSNLFANLMLNGLTVDLNGNVYSNGTLIGYLVNIPSHNGQAQTVIAYDVDNQIGEAQITLTNSGYTLTCGTCSIPNNIANGIESVLYSFGEAPDAQVPLSGLVQASNGSFYGVTSSGGTYNDGAMYSITPAGTETVISAFGGGGVNIVGKPGAGLALGSDGNFYSTTFLDGNMSDGVFGGAVYQVTPSGNATRLYAFPGGANPINPSGLIQGQDGAFYGASVDGGGSNAGAILKTTVSAGTASIPSGNASILYAFPANVTPGSNLIQASDGNFYLITIGNGASNSGAILKVTSAGAASMLYSFGGAPDGMMSNTMACLAGTLVQGNDGNLYGTTACGGKNGKGTFFKISLSGAEAVQYSFGAAPDANAASTLLQGKDGNFYGVSGSGGANSHGTVFKITPAGVENVLYSFGAVPDGQIPAGLMQAKDGNLYGTTTSGGAYDLGTVFKISLPGNPTPIGN